MSQAVALKVKRSVFTNNEPLDDHYDVEAAKQKVIDFLGFPPPKRTCGFQICVALYTRHTNDERLKNPDGTSSLIIAPSTHTANDRYVSCTGMVVQMGEDAYQGVRFDNTGPWCRVGDWVSLPRHEGVQFDYRGKPMFYINDDKIVNVLDDPTQVKRGQYA